MDTINADNFISNNKLVKRDKVKKPDHIYYKTRRGRVAHVGVLANNSPYTIPIYTVCGYMDDKFFGSNFKIVSENTFPICKICNEIMKNPNNGLFRESSRWKYT